MDQLQVVFSNKMQTIWYSWIAIQALVLAFVISAIAAAAEATSKAFGFAVIWVAILTVCFSIGGTMVLKKVQYRSELAVGLMIGISFMEAMFMLTISVISGANFAKLESDSKPSSEKSVMAFSILLTMGYLVLTALLTAHRSILLPAPSMASQDVERGMPEPGNYEGGSGYDASRGGHQKGDQYQRSEDVAVEGRGDTVL